MTHPRDEWVDVTAVGDPAPRRLLAVDGREIEITEARELYVAGLIDIEEFEERVKRALTVVVFNSDAMMGVVPTNPVFDGWSPDGRTFYRGRPPVSSGSGQR
jgi:hypothetical protein